MKKENINFDQSLLHIFFLVSAFKDSAQLPKDRNLLVFEMPETIWDTLSTL